MSWLSSRFELAREGAAHTLRPMEGLRGFAVLLVFLVHYATLARPWLAPGTFAAEAAKALHAVGNCGVDLFFVLSGYLIYGSLIARRQRFGDFMLRRLKRLYPVFSVVFVLYLALSYALPSESKIPADPLAGAVYLLANFLLLSGFGAAPAMISVAWSLSYEMLYYLLLPWLIAVFRLRHRSGAWRTLCIATLLAGALTGFALWGGPVRLLSFGAGILLYEAQVGARGAAVKAGQAMIALAAGLLVMLLPGQPLLKTVVLSGAFFIVCLSCFQQPPNRLARAFSSMPLRWLGNMSYSFYLLHGLALKAGFRLLAMVFPATPQGLFLFMAGLPLMLILALLPSALLFLLVERPLSLTPKRTPPAIAIAL